MANLYTSIVTLFTGRLVGSDKLGNRYYQQRFFVDDDRGARRWILYGKDNKSGAHLSNNRDDASLIPPRYHAWLHGGDDEFPASDLGQRHYWQKDRLPNRTGTARAILPAGARLHDQNIENQAPDYQAWRPDSE